MAALEDRGYFEFLAQLGVTKHYGSLEATREVIALCGIDSGQTVLDVGCGGGATPSYLAKTVGCAVVGADLMAGMVWHARERAEADRVTDRVVFAVADARHLPFKDDHFDAVIMESLNIFFGEKQKAMREYIRVTKPGGHVGMTEMTWLRPPSAKLEEAFRLSARAEALDESGWIALLEEAGLERIVGGGRRIDVSKESRGRFERYGVWRIIKVIPRMLALSLRDRSSRQLLRDAMAGVSRDLLDVVGYGVYAGRKG
jgi:SAM-dependent methyltransferase